MLVAQMCSQIVMLVVRQIESCVHGSKLQSLLSVSVFANSNFLNFFDNFIYFRMETLFKLQFFFLKIENYIYSEMQTRIEFQDRPTAVTGDGILVTQH